MNEYVYVVLGSSYDFLAQVIKIYLQLRSANGCTQDSKPQDYYTHVHLFVPPVYFQQVEHLVIYSMQCATVCITTSHKESRAVYWSPSSSSLQYISILSSGFLLRGSDEPVSSQKFTVSKRYARRLMVIVLLLVGLGLIWI